MIQELTFEEIEEVDGAIGPILASALVGLGIVMVAEFAYGFLKGAISG